MVWDENCVQYRLPSLLSQMHCARARLRSSSNSESGEVALITFFKKSLIAVDSIVSNSRELGHITDPVPGESMSPIRKLALSHSHAVVSPLPSLFSAPPHSPGNSSGIFLYSRTRQRPLLVSNSVDIRVIIICRSRSVALVLTRRFWLLSLWRIWIAAGPDV
jgi:hypothetical protein